MIQLNEIPTRAPKGLEKDDIKRKTERMARRIGELQHIMYAEKKHNFLVVFQGMDASGKDGATRKVFAYCNPTGINAYPFRKPTEEEFSHDFLWRISKRAPAKGMFQIFIRSHYEDVLIQRVHKWIDDDKVSMRIDAINEWEELLQRDNNTSILKFYMHISPERQKKNCRNASMIRSSSGNIMMLTGKKQNCGKNTCLATKMPSTAVRCHGLLPL